MATDAQTMLLMTNAIAFVAAAFLLIEWRSLGERFLLSFALGFLSIVVGSSLAPLRLQGSFMVGVWLSNSMVPLAHLGFLHGAASFSGKRISPAWFMTPVLCCALMAFAGLDAAGSERAQLMSMFNAGSVAILSLKAASVLPSPFRPGPSETRMLACTFLFHGSFYAVKTLCAFVPGAFVDLASYAGTMIVISLFEGVLVAVALAMSITGALRRRREDRVTRLAESDPLTGVLNRRGFEKQVAALPYADGDVCGTLLLIDVDHFKTVNDRFGHQEGDRLLVSLADYLKLRSPAAAIIGRFGGDEFAVILPRIDEMRALDFAQSLCSGFAHRLGPENSGTLSIGCAALLGGIDGLPDAHLRADRSLYDAKNKGRNRASLREATADAPIRPPLSLVASN